MRIHHFGVVARAAAVLELSVGGTRCLALLLLASLCSSSNAKQAAPAPVPDATVVLVGKVDQAMLQVFNDAVSEKGATTVLIASAGGNEREAMQIAETMQARGMDVIVHGLCLGPCAHYILIAGHNRRIEPGTLVGFSDTSAGLSSLLEQVGENVPADFQPGAPWREFAAAEERLYQQSGISKSLLLDMQVALQPRCIIFSRHDGKAGGISVSRSYAVWVPTSQYLASVGLRFEGYWPKSRREMTRSAVPFLKAQPRQVDLVRFGDDDNLRRLGQPKYVLRNLKACAMEEDANPPALAPADATPAAN